MKKVFALLTALALFSGTATYGSDNKATPEDVYNLVLSAYEVVQSLGDEAIPAFNDPKGEFVLKDTYVYVEKCPSEMVAHPFAGDKLQGIDLLAQFPFNAKLCDAARQPGGSWAEYRWPKPGETDPSRKIAFAVNVEGTPYTIMAGIYSDTAKVEDLNKTLR